MTKGLRNGCCILRMGYTSYIRTSQLLEEVQLLFSFLITGMLPAFICFVILHSPLSATIILQKAGFCLLPFYITLHDFFIQFLYTFVAGRTKATVPDYAGCAEVFCIFCRFSEMFCRISGVFSSVASFYTRTDGYIEKADVQHAHLPNFPVCFA